MDEAKPIYVGISRGLIKRLRDHVLGSDHMVATLAYRIAAKKHPHRKTASLYPKRGFQSRYLGKSPEMTLQKDFFSVLTKASVRSVDSGMHEQYWQTEERQRSHLAVRRGHTRARGAMLCRGYRAIQGALGQGQGIPGIITLFREVFIL